MVQPKERPPAGWGGRSGASRGFRGLTPASAALMLVVERQNLAGPGEERS